MCINATFLLRLTGITKKLTLSLTLLEASCPTQQTSWMHSASRLSFKNESLWQPFWTCSRLHLLYSLGNDMDYIRNWSSEIILFSYNQRHHNNTQNLYFCLWAMYLKQSKDINENHAARPTFPPTKHTCIWIPWMKPWHIIIIKIMYNKTWYIARACSITPKNLDTILYLYC